MNSLTAASSGLQKISPNVVYRMVECAWCGDLAELDRLLMSHPEIGDAVNSNDGMHLLAMANFSPNGSTKLFTQVMRVLRMLDEYGNYVPSHKRTYPTPHSHVI